MTHEEGAIIVPSLAISTGWFFRRISLPTSQENMRSAALLLTAAICPILAVCVLNYADYHVFRANDFQTGPFPRAYGALSRIHQEHWDPMVPVPSDARASAYSVSAAARELQPYLDGDVGRYWADIGCRSHPYPGCRDIQAGWFMWAFRESVTRAGHYASAPEADRFYTLLASEINAACDKSALKCSGWRSGYLPPLRSAYFLPILRSAVRIIGEVIWLGHPLPTAFPTLAQGSAAADYARVTLAARSVRPKSTPMLANGISQACCQTPIQTRRSESRHRWERQSSRTYACNPPPNMMAR